jgi:type IV pilus secretin PilQ/predicted competence protein
MTPPEPTTTAPAARTITLNMNKGEIGDALRLVAEQGGLNLVIGPEVKGEVSVYLTEASLETALKAIAVNNGFAFTMEEGVITVSRPPEKPATQAPPMPPLHTRIFKLRCVDAERVKDALEHALTKTPEGRPYGQIKVLNENSNPGYGVQRLDSLSGDLSASSAASAGGTSFAQNTTNGAATGPRPPGGPAGGEALAQPRNARTLVMTDTRENLERIADLIADLDKLPPQVLIEARIVEMSTDLQRRLGIDWNVSALANGPILNHEWPIRNKAGFASGAQVRRAPDGTAQASAGLALGTIDFSQFTALVQANQNDNAIRLLANPRLLVYNNHSASILVGERYPILQASISNFGTVTEAFQTYIPVGVQLEVTPTIMMDGKISLLVHPATSSLGDDVVGTTGLHVARIRTRELDTRVIMSDGDTIVLGGLISDRKIHSASKVPGLGDLPILDVLFRSERPSAERVDLLIFLTAHVEGATEITVRDQRVFDMYRPHFKHIERLQDVPLHFEIPTEYEPPRPMFSDPPLLEEFDEEPLEPEPEPGGDAGGKPGLSPSRPRRAQANARLKVEEAP